MQGLRQYQPDSIRRYMLGQDMRSNRGTFARGNPYQARMNKYTNNPEAIQRRLERMQGRGTQRGS